MGRNKKMFFMHMFRADATSFYLFQEKMYEVLLLSHVIQMIFFGFYRAYPVIIANACFAVCDILGIRICKKEEVIIKAYALMLISEVAYSLLATVLLGNAFAYDMFILSLIVLACLTQYALAVRYLMGLEKQKVMLLFPSLVFLFLSYSAGQILSVACEPLVKMDMPVYVVNTVRFLNLFVNVNYIIMGCGLFFSYAVGYAAELKKNMGQLQELKNAAEAASRAKSMFLANVTHEIRTPMNAICGTASLLRDEELPPKAEDYTFIIQTAAEHLLNIINDVLDYSKIESGKLELVPREYSVNELVRGVMEILSLKAKEKNLQLIAQIADDIPASLVGDVNRIRQVIINLLINAIKFTKEGSVTLKLSFETDSENPQQGYLICSVIDTGCGIKEEDIGKLFMAFEQLEQEKNVGIEGTGLGLSICQRLVTAMGGGISVVSAYEKGSTFFFRIVQPIADSTPCNYNSTKDQTTKKKREETVVVENARCLIVDDNRVNLKVASALMERKGFAVDVAQSGMEAIEKLEHGEIYDLIFMDYLMPEMDGAQATRRIRKLEECREKQPVIIALSANVLTEASREMHEAGMNDVLPKPIKTEALDTILQKWVASDKIRKKL